MHGPGCVPGMVLSAGSQEVCALVDRASAEENSPLPACSAHDCEMEQFQTCPEEKEEIGDGPGVEVGWGE